MEIQEILKKDYIILDSKSFLDIIRMVQDSDRKESRSGVCSKKRAMKILGVKSNKGFYDICEREGIIKMGHNRYSLKSIYRVLGE